MNCGVGCRRGSDPALLWLWRRPAATAPIRPLAWEPPYAALEIAKKPKNKQTNKQKIPNRYFFKEDIQMANKHRKRCLTPHITRETQIKTHNERPLHTHQNSFYRNKQNTENSKCWCGYGETGTLVHSSENIKWCSSYGKQCYSSSKN